MKEFTKEGKSRVCWKPWKKTGEGAGNRSERRRILRWREKNWEEREETLGNLKRSSVICKIVMSLSTEEQMRGKRKKAQKSCQRGSMKYHEAMEEIFRTCGWGSSKHLYLVYWGKNANPRSDMGKGVISRTQKGVPLKRRTRKQGRKDTRGFC